VDQLAEFSRSKVRSWYVEAVVGTSAVTRHHCLNFNTANPAERRTGLAERESTGAAYRGNIATGAQRVEFARRCTSPAMIWWMRSAPRAIASPR
jgi:hypothetical protein